MKYDGRSIKWTVSISIIPHPRRIRRRRGHLPARVAPQSGRLPCSLAGRLPGSGVSILKEHLFPLGWKVTDNAFVHYREGKAIHHSYVHALACVCVCTICACADCMQVVLLSSRLWCGYGREEREREGVGEEEALRVDARQAEHLETGTLTGVKRGRVIYLVGGRGNTGSIFLLMKNWCSQTHCSACVLCQRLPFQHQMLSCN